MMRQAMKERGLLLQWRCPALDPSPAAAIEQARQEALELCESQQKPVNELTIVGSSLGGFYATVLAEMLGCKAVLINPAVHAARDLATQVGEHSNFHNGEPFVFHAHYVDELKAMTPAKLTNLDRYYLIAATGDEVLDWTEMRDYFQGARQTIVPGSDHGLSNFAKYLPGVLAFAYPET